MRDAGDRPRPRRQEHKEKGNDKMNKKAKGSGREAKAARKGEHKIFVYGTLLTGERNARWAGKAKREGAWATGTLHDTGWGYPAFTPEGKTKIVGEVLTATDEQFRSMDYLEGYPQFYSREQIQVNLVGGGCVLAWVYILKCLPVGAKVIANGDWRRRGEG